ncbi:MAG TPA: TlpA disulfide reductase family protein [Actinopolymorphaceae bacterium]
MQQAVMVLACLLAVSACSSGPDQPDARGGSEAGFVSGTGTVTTIPPAERKQAPDLQGQTLDGKTIRLSDYRGSVVVVNVWGSWCAPCRKEARELAEASEALAGKGTKFLGINTRDPDPGPARAFVRNFDVPYPSVYDPDGKLLLGFRDTLPPSAIPSTVIIDRQGRVAARILGATTRRTIEQLATDVRDST